MNASDFVRELSAVAPSVESLLAIGLSATESESFRSGYICTSRRHASPLIASNEMLDLANRWDVGKVEIGMVRLLGTPTRHHACGIQVGIVEADPLVIADATSELIVEEAGSGGHILWKTAESSGRFLDALVLAAKFFTDRTVGVVSFGDLEAARATADKCSELAGGDAYAGFYAMLLGAG